MSVFARDFVLAYRRKRIRKSVNGTTSFKPLGDALHVLVLAAPLQGVADGQLHGAPDARFASST